ncbi:MAG: TolC family protein [Lentisphaerae bacterium]|nr:TolC family protein [Lentisphaerota bacterium]
MITRQHIVAAIGLAAVLNAAAAPTNAAPELALDSMVQEALRENAGLRAARAQWEAMRERPPQQRALPNPMATYRGMDRASGGAFPDTPEQRLELEQQVPAFGKRALRGRIAEKEAEAMGREVEAMGREVVMRVKENYFGLYAAQQALAITRAEEDVLRRMEQIATTKYSTGGAVQQDVLKAQAELSMLKTRLYELERQEGVLKAKLNQLLNRRADSPLGSAVMPSPQNGAPLAGDVFELAREARPEIKEARARLERAQLDRNLMKKEYWPDVKLGVEYRRLDQDEDMAMLAVGVDLPIWFPKYNAGVREAGKTIVSSRAALEAAEQQTAFDVQDAVFKLTTARRVVELYKTALIPQAEARFSASEAGYRTGKTDFLDLLESERFLLNIRVMTAMAEGDLGMELARLERAVGKDLSADGIPSGSGEGKESGERRAERKGEPVSR